MTPKFARLEFELFTRPPKFDFLRVHQNYEIAKCTAIQDDMGLIKWLLILFDIWTLRFGICLAFGVCNL
jgi:hypothetical protein